MGVTGFSFPYAPFGFGPLFGKVIFQQQSLVCEHKYLGGCSMQEMRDGLAQG